MIEQEYVPSLFHYSESSFILKDSSQLDIWKIHRQSFDSGQKIAEGDGVQIWLVSEDLANYEQWEWKSLVQSQQIELTYVLLKTKCFGKCFDKEGYLKLNRVIGYIQIDRQLLKLGKKQYNTINPRYTTNKDAYKYLKASEIKLSYIVERFRGKGYGRFLYRWVLYSEKVLKTGYCLHSHKDRIDGSLAIWKRLFTKSYKVAVHDKVYNKIVPFVENNRSNWNRSSRSILVSCGRILKDG